MPKVLVVYNPISGTRYLRTSAGKVQELLQAQNVDYAWMETTPDLREILAEYPLQHFERIVVVGGDGTVREVAEFLIDNNLKIPIGIVAQGSANAVAYSLGLPMFSLQRSLSFALNEEAQAFDVMIVNGKHIALIAAGQGHDALLMRHADRELKKMFGLFAYGISFLKTFFLCKTKDCTITIDGKKITTHAKVAAAVNMFSIAGIPLDHAISPQDGFLDVFAFNPRSLWDVLIAIIARILLRRPREQIPRTQTFTGKQISIHLHGSEHFQIDGEVFDGESLTIAVMPRVLHIVSKKRFTTV